ncbi:hypothetical protein DV515_00001803 [Chloebia gouldiae]|uniref:Uncharacterized protein n=1 Tax=Chloebia gouldiae TaxID=44316 RepID=A0A3L8SY24_CHLGU|nr:hypothetical protein DV515_00001803 [Chloebia gouldiae]
MWRSEPAGSAVIAREDVTTQFLSMLVQVNQLKKEISKFARQSKDHCLPWKHPWLSSQSGHEADDQNACKSSYKMKLHMDTEKPMLWMTATMKGRNTYYEKPSLAEQGSINC